MASSVRSLIAAFCVCVVSAVALLAPSKAFAQLGNASISCDSRVNAKALAEASYSGVMDRYDMVEDPPRYDTRNDGSGFWGGNYNLVEKGTGRGGGSWGWSCPDVAAPPPPKGPCESMAPVTSNFPGTVLNGSVACPATKDSSGATVKCNAVFQALADPFVNSSGTTLTYGTLTPSGTVCAEGSGTGGGWQAPPDKPVVAPTPPALPETPIDNSVPPKSCGTVSCYDPQAGQYCTEGSSGTICTKGSAPNISTGSCSSSGESTICSGSPQAPAPPVTKVPDPPTATRGTDVITHTSADTGDKYNTTTTVYNNGVGPVKSGATAGDSTPPASSSSSATPADPSTPDKDKDGDGTAASGGGDCNNPPSVEGSAALGMIAMETWQTRCAVEGGPVDTTDKTVPGLEGMPDGVADADSPVHVLDGIGAKPLDESGFFAGNGKCPAFPSMDFPATIATSSVHYDGPPPGWCDIVAVVGKLVLLLAAIWSYILLNGK